jgi:hypothetical protein
MQRRVSHLPFLPTALNCLCLAAITLCIHIFHLLKWPLSDVTHLPYHAHIHSTIYIHGLASSLVVSSCSSDVVSQFQRNVLCVCPCGDLKNEGWGDPAHWCYTAVQIWTQESSHNAACGLGGIDTSGPPTVVLTLPLLLTGIICLILHTPIYICVA